MLEISMDYKEDFTKPGGKLQFFGLTGEGLWCSAHSLIHKPHRAVNFCLINNTLKKNLSQNTDYRFV